MMFLRIWNLVRKEIIQLARDRVLTTLIFVLPILQLVLLAQATGRRIGDLGVAVLDLDRSAVTRQLIADLDNREELAVRYFVEDEARLRDLLDRGKAQVGVIFPRGLARDLADPTRTAQVRVVVDGSNSVVGSVALSGASAVFTAYGQERLRERGLAAAPLVDLRVETRYNPAYNIRHFTIPAQVGFITYQIALVIASLGLARERELGTLEQLIVAPLSRLELVLGKAVPAFIIGGLNFLVMLGVAIHLFRVPLRGSFLLLLGLTLPFIVAEVGWGVLISATARTQQQAILFVFILAIVDVTFSGFMVPVKNLPGLLQLIARVVPMYHYLVVIRAVMLKGATMATLWPHALALVGLGGAVLGVSVVGVSRRLD
jgi:ABC-2 type transport system permease protein